MASSPLLKLFKTSTQDFYLFDANKNYILAIDGEIYSVLDELLTFDDFYEAVSEVKSKHFIEFYTRALRDGFFKNNRVEEIEHPMGKFLDVMLKDNLSSVCLQVTQNCNLRCDYCPYTGNYYENRGHENKRMSFSLAQKAIDYLARHSSGSRRLNIAFYGGEPLLEVDLIRKCITYADALFEEKFHTYSITTNGTLLDEEIIELLVYNNVYLTVSIDGPQAIHDRSRVYADGRGSFSTIIKKLQWLRDTQPEYFGKYVSFNTVLSELGDFTCVDDFFSAKDLFEQSVIGTTFYNDTYIKKEHERSKSFSEDLQYERFKYFLSRLGRIHMKSVINANAFEQLARTAKMITPFEHLPKKFHPSGPCIPGYFKPFLNAEGNFYPCERVNEKSDVSIIGNIETGIDPEKCKYLLNIAKITESDCKNCWAFLYCRMCFIKADENGVLSSEKRLSFCEQMKAFIVEDFKDICVMKKHGFAFL